MSVAYRLWTVRHIGVMVALTAACLFASAPRAAANVVSIRQCKDAGGAIIDSSLTSYSGAGSWLGIADCGIRDQGSALASFLKAGAEPSQAVANLTFTAPGNTRFVAYHVHRTLRNYVYYSSTDRTATAYDSWGLGYRLTDDAGRVLERCGGGTVPTSGRGNCTAGSGGDPLPGDQVSLIETTKHVNLQFGCFTAGYCSHFVDAPGLYDVYGHFAVEDTGAPGVSFVGGPLSEPGNVIAASDDVLTIGASDLGGLGVSAVRFSIDGGAETEVGWPGRPASCQDVDPKPDAVVYNAGQPCEPSPQTSTIELPSTSDGEHRVKASVVDAAGNSTTAVDHVVVVDRRAPDLPNDPTISGTASVGSVLTCSIAGVEAQSPTVALQWIRARADGSHADEVPRATGADYRVSDADIGSKLLCRVTVTDRGGSSSRTSTLTSGPFDGGATVTGGSPSGEPSAGDGAVTGGSPSGETSPSSGANDTGTSPGGVTGNAAGPGASSATSAAATLGTAAGTAVGPAGQGSVQGPSAPAAGCPISTLVTLEGSTRLAAKRTASATTVAGAVRSGTGAPAGGVVVDLVQRVRRDGVAPTTVASSVSGSDGRFALKAPVGPSRDLQVVTRSCGASGPVVGQSVRGQVRLRAVNPRLRNGQTVRFSGQAVGGYYGKGVS